MKKRVFGMMLAICLLVSSVTAMATDYDDGIHSFSFDEETGTLTIHSASCITIDSLGLYAQSGIDTSSINAIVIDEGISSIDSHCFMGFTSPKSLTISEGVTEIWEFAFWGCSSLTEVNLPESLTTLGNGAFANCSSLTSIVIPKNVGNIPYHLFYECEQLTSITFTGDAPSFGSEAFSSLTATVYYPAGNATWTEDVMQQYDGAITWVAYDAEASTDATYQVGIGELVTVPSELAGAYASADLLRDALIDMVTESQPKENAAVYDITLSTSTDGGTTWQEVTGENFSESGITVTIPYPEGTDSSYTFVVAHMFSETNETLGTVAGEVEFPTVTKTDNGIQVTLKGLSPVAVSWALSSLTEDAAGEITLGDASGDGEINYLDAMAVLRYDAELTDLSDAQLAAADVNGDGSVDSLDAILILRYDAGLIESFE